MSAKIISQALQVATSQEWISYWRKSNHGKVISQYKTGRWTACKHIIKQDEPYLIAFLMNYLDIDIHRGMKLTTVMNGMSRKVDDDKNKIETFTDSRDNDLITSISRYGSITKNYRELEAEIQSEIFEIATINETTNVLIYRRDKKTQLQKAMVEFAKSLTTSLSGMKIKQYKETDLTMIRIREFSRMDLGGKCQVLKSFVKSRNGKMYIKLNTKRDIGNHGRTYNILDSLSRNNRTHIEMYGFDLETALQAIWTSILETVIDLSETREYIDNKDKIREQVAKMMDWSKKKTKMELTAIYQGRNFNKKKYAPLEDIFTEVHELREYIMNNLRGDGSVADIYATRKTNEKLAKSLGKTYDAKIHCVRGYDKLKDRMKKSLANTYMFFYWTYYEGIIQQIVVKMMNNTNQTVHDGIYVQHEWDMIGLTKEKVEAEIFRETGIDVKVKYEISKSGREVRAKRMEVINNLMVKELGFGTA